MDIFLSWSGTRSHAAAEALKGWLPKVVNAFNPWISAADIQKGTRWGIDVANRLQSAKAGIICLTPANLHADWIFFEAGALSKTMDNTFVCPFLIDLQPTDVKPPLSQFQATRANRDDILKLVKTLNRALGTDALSEAHIDDVFEMSWPKLCKQLEVLPSDDVSASVRRTDRDVLEEILALVRSQSRMIESQDTYRTLRAVLRTITPREEKVLKMLYGVDDDFHTIDEVAEAFAVTPDEIKTIEANALRKLRHASRLGPATDLLFSHDARHK